MPVGSALVDRARRVYAQTTGVKVEGTTQHVLTEGPWFRCRLMPTDQPENPDASGGRRRVEKRPNFMFEKLDQHGEPVNLTVEDKLEVESPELGRAIWKLLGDPVAIRRKRTINHFEVNLRRVEDHDQGEV